MEVCNVHVTWGYGRLATGPCSINLNLSEYEKVKKRSSKLQKRVSLPIRYGPSEPKPLGHLHLRPFSSCFKANWNEVFSLAWVGDQEKSFQNLLTLCPEPFGLTVDDNSSTLRCSLQPLVSNRIVLLEPGLWASS